MRFTALLDANILYPAPLRDLFMRLAVSDIFAARWTERIHDEWMRNVTKKPTRSGQRTVGTHKKFNEQPCSRLPSGRFRTIRGRLAAAR